MLLWTRLFLTISLLVDIREIKEVRETLDCYDNKRPPDDLKSIDQNATFVILYGTEFRLKTLSVGGKIAILNLHTEKCTY